MSSASLTPRYQPRYQRVLQNALRMLRDRGYTVPESAEAYEIVPDQVNVICFTEFASVHGNPAYLPRAYQFVYITRKAGIGDVNEYLEPDDHCATLLVYSDITHKASEAIAENSKNTEGSKSIDAFHENMLVINPVTHACYSPHMLLSDQEHYDLMQKSPDMKMAIISSDDVIVRYFNWPNGRVVKITRNWGGTIPTTVVYRIIRRVVYSTKKDK